MPNIIRVIKSSRVRWVWHMASMGTGEVRTVLVRKPQRNRPLGRPRRRCEHNTKMDLKEVG
jgi:hypothetical protein